MKRIAIALAWLAISLGQAQGVDFDAVFSDSTLRLDYILSGTPSDIGIGLKQMHMKEGWSGRKCNLPELLYAGNGQVTVTSMEGDTLYRNSFSTLFNEWLDIADNRPSTCECPLLVPFPKDSVMMSVSLLDKHHQPIATASHVVDPADILIRRSNTVADHEYLRKGAYEGDKIGVAILAEGYTQAEMDTFMDDARQAVDAILSHEPFKQMRERFDFIAVKTPSVDSGASVPLANDWRNTAFDSHFSTFYSDRYLTSPSVFKMHDALNGIDADHIIVLVNTDVYGGGGIFNAYTLTAAHHEQFRPVVAHEFGHSFGGLADEYFYETEVMADTYPTDAEPWEPNITTLVDFQSKWQGMLPDGTPVPTDPSLAQEYPVGVYEGGGYSFHGIYRPADVCRMRVNNVDAFCPACQSALLRIIKFYTEPEKITEQ